MKRYAFLLFVFSRLAVAAETPEELLKPGRAHFADGDWKRAVKAHSDAVTKIRDNKWRAVAFKEIGLAQVEIKWRKAAAESFVMALSADPLIDVNPVVDTPEAVALFRETRGRLEGTLVVTTDQPRATVVIDGVARGEAPFSGTLKIGRHRIDAMTSLGQYAVTHQEAIVRVGETTTLDLKLTARVGFLTVNGPPGLRVSLDGVAVGVTPLVRAPVAPEKRTLVVERPGGEPFVMKVDLTSGVEKVVAVEPVAKSAGGDSKPVPEIKNGTTSKHEPLRTEWVVRPRRTRIWSYIAMGTAAAALTVGAILYWNPPTPSNESLETYNSGVRSHNTSIDVGGGLLVAGSLSAVASAVLFFLHRDGERKPAVVFSPQLFAGSSVGIGVAIHR